MNDATVTPPSGPEGNRDAIPHLLNDPEQIGPYRIVERLGEGGMGVVYLAEQTHPIQRRVAVKVIKLGMDTREVVARFEAERQALALMTHPNIARIFEAGATPGGRPYFVMEYVSGEPITEFCDARKLTNAERTDVFIEVCDAVQHAHQKGVIHRDLKPSNIMVGVHGDRVIPKIIDFGVAKATQARPSGDQFQTQLGVIVGTPEYMSPEQADKNVEDIDTRSDVYALGMVLYELLVGALPFNPQSLRVITSDEVKRRVREAPLPNPATRVRALGEYAARPAEHRRTDAASLARSLKGDIEWVVMKALDPDRNRRYGSAAEFAVDLRSYRRGDVVTARPASWSYRARKFVVRHRGPVAAAAALVVVLAGYGATVTAQNRRIQLALEQALVETDRATRLTDFLMQLLEDPGAADSDARVTAQLLERGIALAEQLGSQPEARAQVLTALGRVNRHLGDYAEAARLLEEAVQLQRSVYGDRHLNVAESMVALGDVYRIMNRQPEAERILREALVTERALLGAEHPRIARTITELHLAIRDNDDYAAAEPLAREALAMRRRLLGTNHPDVAESVNYLAALLRRMGDYDASGPLYEDALAMRRRFYPGDHSLVAESLNNLALQYQQTGDLERSEPLYREAAAMYARIFGDEHPFTATVKANLANVVLQMGQYDEARGLYHEVLTTRIRVFGEEHPDVAVAISGLGTVARREGNLDEAESLNREALAIRVRTRGERSRDAASSLHALGLVMVARGDLEGAAREWERALDIRMEVMGEAHVSTGNTHYELGIVLVDLDRPAEAESHLVRALDIRRGAYGDIHAITRSAAAALVTLYEAEGRIDDAARIRPLVSGR